MKRVARWLMMLMGLMLAISALGEGALTVDDQDVYEKVQHDIDQGDCSGVAEMLLDGSISTELYAYLMQENAQVMERVILDAMIEFGKNGDVKSTAALRMGGYVTDACLADYWEVMGSTLPESMPAEDNTPELDEYLIHELCEAFRRDDYAVRGLHELRTSGVLTDAMHAALVNALGFDYTDEQYMDEHGIAPIRVLTAEEKAVYDQVMLCIDEGDCNAVAQMLYGGEVSENTYRCLMQQDGDMVDFVLSQGLANMAQNGELLAIVQLRAFGYVSDRCFEYYWESIGGELIQASEEEQAGIDRYLLQELKRICLAVSDGVKIVREVWQSGMMTDPMHDALVQELGFDYLQH